MLVKKKIVYAILIALGICVAGCGQKTDSHLEITDNSNFHDIKDSDPKKAGESGGESEELSDTNIEFIFDGKISSKENAEWKEAYVPIVRQWDVQHSMDYSYGYELVYIDDNDVPELVLACDDEAWEAYDIYTCIDGKAVQLRFEDGRIEERISDHVSPGHQGKEDTYIEKSGIYMQHSGMMGTHQIEGFVLDGNEFKEAFNYFYYDLSWDETAENPYGYSIEYIDSNGERVTKEVVTDGDGKYYEIDGAPEAEQIEKIYNIDFDKVKSFNCTMNYKEICSLLDMDEMSISLSEKEKYAKLLYEYMKDSDKRIRIHEFDGGYTYQNCGGKFMLKDLNGDGRDEMILTVMSNEYSVFVPKDTWEDSYLWDMEAYSGDGILRHHWGETFSSIYEYRKFTGDSLEPYDYYESWDDTEYSGNMEYTRRDGAGNETQITEAEFNAGSSLYNARNVTGTWYEINEENIRDILLDAKDGGDKGGNSTDNANGHFIVTVAAPDGGVNLRSGPGTDYDILVKMIPNGKEMDGREIVELSGGKKWIRVIYEGTEGYVAASQVEY